MSHLKMVAGISFSWFRFAFGFLVAFIQIPIIFKCLPKEIVGIWFLFYSAAAFLQMSDFGLPSAVSRAIAYLKNDKIDIDQREVKFYRQFTIRDIYYSSLISFSIISLLVVVISTTLIFAFKPSFGVNQVFVNEVSFSFTIFIFGIFFNMTSNIPYACLNGMGDVGYDNLFKLIIQLLGLILVLLILPVLPSILTLSFIYLGQSILSAVLVHIFVRHKYKHLFSLKGTFDFILVKKLYSESFPLFVNQIGGWMINQSSIWIASYTLGVYMIADYTVLSQLVFYGLSISMSIPAAVNPYAISSFASGGIYQLSKYFFLTMKLSFFIVGLWVIILSVWSSILLKLWVGDGHFLGIYVLIPMLLNLILEVQHSICGGFVWNSGKWPFVPATISSGVLNLLFGFLGSTYFGFIGLSMATFLAKLFTLNWYVVFVSLKRLKISFKKYFMDFVKPVLSLWLFTLLISLLAKRFSEFVVFDFSFTYKGISGDVIFSFFSNIIFIFTIWTLLYYKFLFNRDDKSLLKMFIISNIAKVFK